MVLDGVNGKTGDGEDKEEDDDDNCDRNVFLHHDGDGPGARVGVAVEM